MPYKRLVEEWLPLREMNLHTSLEMAFRGMAGKFRDEFLEIYGISPKKIGVGTTLLRNLHPWPARRPTAPARLLTLASVLPSTFDREYFKKLSGLFQIPDLAKQDILPILLHADPLRNEIEEVLARCGKNTREISIVDPMAGGGSIPLEALRLGFKTIAIEYNPVAYLILKATLEYPAKYGMRLYEELRAEAKRLMNWAREELGKYYPEDAMNYIIARGYRCRSCGGLIPIIHSTRLGKNGPYIKLTFDKEGKSFTVDISSVETEFTRLRCPYCKAPVVEDLALRDWASRHKRLLKTVLSGDFKQAKESIGELTQTHILLVKQTERGFTATSKEDVDRFTEAYLDLARLVGELREFIPSDPIPRENEVFKPVTDLGIEYWYELFNPRQLLILAKLIGYVKARTKKLIEGMAEFGVAIGLYLALGIDKLSDYNNIATQWHSSRGVMDRLVGRYEEPGRKVSLGLEYCEMPPIAEDPRKSLGWVFEPDVEKPTATHGGICPVVRHLCSWVDGLGGRVNVLMADAMSLSKILGERSIDVVNVDPPYLDQHTYSDLSEFFWQILRMTLAPAIDAGYLFSRGERGITELFVAGWSPILSTVPRDSELIERKTAKPSVKGEGVLEILERMKTPHSRDWYVKGMYVFFREAYKALKDDGVLIVWFTHSDPEAWEGILSALYASGFVVTKVWTVKTEMAERRVALAGSAFFSSLAIIARKAGDRVVVGTGNVRDLSVNEEVKQAIVSSTVDALQSALESGASEHERYIMALAGAIAGATRIWNPTLEATSVKHATRTMNEFTRAEGLEVEDASRFARILRFFRSSLYPVALYHGVSRVLEEAVKEAFTKAGLEKSLVEKMADDILLVDNDSKAYILLWMSTRFSEEPTIEYDFGEKICKVIGTSLNRLRDLGLLEAKGRESTRRIAYGRRAIELVKHRVETLDKTASGMALRLTKILADIPAVEEVDKAAERVKMLFPVSRQVAALALFLMLTAKQEELESFGIKLNKPFIENVLKLLYEGGIVK
jgi:adenine-specific DNA methylase